MFNPEDVIANFAANLTEKLLTAGAAKLRELAANLHHLMEETNL